MSDLMVTLSHNELQCHHLPGALTATFEEGGGVSLCPGVFWPLQVVWARGRCWALGPANCARGPGSTTC